MLLKDFYNNNFYNILADVIKKFYPEFSKEKFFNEVFTSEFAKYELKQRMRHTTLILRKHLPQNNTDSVNIINQICDEFKSSKRNLNGFEFMIFPDYIELFCIDELELAITSIEKITQLISCEFAVRPFLIKYRERMEVQMLNWSKHSHHGVRRLSSEGIRPRLPWAMALPYYKKNPELIISILENLINDDNESVRRSVANNLNDISKDNPEIFIKFLKKWKGNSELSDKILKHASRTLFKKGDTEVLKIFGLKNSDKIIFSNFKLKSDKIKSGEKLFFEFSIENTGRKSENLRLEYAIYFRIKSGRQNKKVFKISEKILKKNEKINFQKYHNFKPITTRKFYEGEHQISIIINGVEKKIKKFNLTL